MEAIASVSCFGLATFGFLNQCSGEVLALDSENQAVSAKRSEYLERSRRQIDKRKTYRVDRPLPRS